MRGRGAAAAAAWCVVLALCAGTAAAVEPPLQYSVSNRSAVQFGSAKPVAPIASGFVGASMDYCAITEYTGAQTDPVLDRRQRARHPVPVGPAGDHGRS
jgi:hypothetical protein